MFAPPVQSPRWLHLQRAFLLTLAGLVGCAGVPLTSSNLDALLDGDDNLRHRAAVQEPLRYYLAGMMDPRWLKQESWLSKSKKKDIGDPAYEALKYLLQLEDPPAGTTKPDYQHMEQVRQFARFAARCPGKLVRERALLALIPHGQRLGVAGPQASPKTPANAPELQSVLDGLVQAAEPLLRAAGRADATRRSDLEAAVELFQDLELDIDGGWRALRSIATLAGSVDIGREELAPLLELALDLERRMVGLALASGHQDPDPYVRAAAAKATHAIVGEAFLVDLLRSLSAGLGGDAKSAYGLRPEAPAKPDVFVMAFGLVREHGLPSSPGLDLVERRQERYELLRGMLSVVYETELFDERPRTMAMLALSEALPDGPRSLRKEDWTDWWKTWAEQELAELDLERERRGDSQP